MIKNENNAELGMTIQKIICDMYNTPYNTKAAKSFESAFNPNYTKKLIPILHNIFSDINSIPIKCTTLEPSPNPAERDLPFNFILENGKTISIKANKNKNSAKICPNIVGQCGYDKLNYYFGHLLSHPIETQSDIKELFLNKPHKVLPIFIDYMFIADITIFIYQNKNDEFDYKIVPRELAPDIKFKKKLITFTHIIKEKEWNESTTLKVFLGKFISIAEIQVHKNRTFKFRFSLDKIISLLKKIDHNNETLGMSAEKSICDYFNLKYEPNLASRSNSELVEILINSCIEDAFKYLPKAVAHTGSLPGKRGGTSKSSFDFLLENNKTLSLKTNYGKMVCPPEVGQPSAETFLLYFGHLLNGSINSKIFKELVISNIHKMIPLYFEKLLDSDYLLWIFNTKNGFKYKILNSFDTNKMIWDKSKFTFTRNLDTWTESTTVKYNNKSLGEFQVHSSRNCYKFRFNMKNLLEILEMEGIIF